MEHFLISSAFIPYNRVLVKKNLNFPVAKSSKESVITHDAWLAFIYLTYNSLAKARLVWHVRMNFISNKNLNNGTFSCFKRFLTPYRTRDMKTKIQNFPS